MPALEGWNPGKTWAPAAVGTVIVPVPSAFDPVTDGNTELAMKEFGSPAVML